MPLYDYKCKECSHRFEVRQPFGSESTLACPECGSEASRQYHSMAIIYKGSGFYTTDYARKHVSPAGESSSSNGSSGDSSGDETKSSDSKSGESKADSKVSDSKASESPSDSKKGESKSESSSETSTKTSSDTSHSHPH